MGIMSAMWIKTAIMNCVTVFDKKGEWLRKPLFSPIKESDKRMSYIEGSAFDITLNKIESPDHPYVTSIIDGYNTNALFIGVDNRVTPVLGKVPFTRCYLVKRIEDGKEKAYVTTEIPDLRKLECVYNTQVKFEEIDDAWMLEKDKYYMAESVEEINVPLKIAALLNPRTTLFRGGLAIHCSWAHPNYQGVLNVGIENRRTTPAFIRQNSRFLTVHLFELMESGVSSLAGKALAMGEKEKYLISEFNPYGCSDECVSAWQGGKKSTNGEVIGGH
jgi:deoxycytidine triphosphate deaminase